MRIQTPFLIGAIVAFVAPLAASQEPTPVAKPTPKTDSRPAQVTIPAADADPAKKGTSSRPSESRPSVLFHARVQVVLKNGQKLQGVVKNNRFVEKESGLGFAVATKDEPMCGLRLWFTSPGQNWLFLSYRDLTSVDTIGRISDIEVRELEAKLDAEMNGKLAKETAERVGEVQAELKAREDARKAEQAASEKAKKEEALKKLKEEVENAKKIVGRFPPENGWDEDRKKEILAKKVAHIYPTPEEADFLKSYDEWSKAKKVLEKADKIEKGEVNPDEEEPASDEPEQKPKKKSSPKPKEEDNPR